VEALRVQCLQGRKAARTGTGVSGEGQAAGPPGSGATRQRGHCVHLVEAGDYARAVAHAHDGQDSERPGAGGQEGRSAGHGSAGDGCTRAAGQRRRA